jgi:2-hydroxy-6-oxonona-2,4-dienedioate hydrolase
VTHSLGDEASQARDRPPDVDTVWLNLLDAGFDLKWVDVAGARTRVLVAGSGPPLVFLHGTGGHLEAYARNVTAFARHFKVIAYDMLGHGYTDKPSIPYTVNRLAEHLVGLLDSLGIASAALSGESLGGWVAAWTAAYFPKRVNQLVLNTPGNILAKPEVMARIKQSSLQAVQEPTYENVRARLEWLFLDKSMVTDELVRVRQRIYSQPDFESAMRNILVLQDPVIRERYGWSRAWVSQIKVPTLIIWTTDDPTGDVKEGELLLSWLFDGKLEVIRDAGHWPQWEKPAEFLDLHLRFLKHEKAGAS